MDAYPEILSLMDEAKRTDCVLEKEVELISGSCQAPPWMKMIQRLVPFDCSTGRGMQMSNVLRDDSSEYWMPISYFG